MARRRGSFRRVCRNGWRYAASRHGRIVPRRITKNASHASVSYLVADRRMCFDTAADEVSEKWFYMT